MTVASKELFAAALRDLTPAGRRSVVSCMAMYLKSIDACTPTFFLPKEIGDSIGTPKLAEIANSYAKIIGGDVSLVFDKTFNVFRIAPPEYLVGTWDLTYLDTAAKRPVFEIPRRKWERMVDLELDSEIQATPADEVENIRTRATNTKKQSNSFILFRRANRRIVQERYPTATLAQISIITAEMWAHAEKAERLPYIREAQKLNELHHKKTLQRSKFRAAMSRPIPRQLEAPSGSTI